MGSINIMQLADRPQPPRCEPPDVLLTPRLGNRACSITTGRKSRSTRAAKRVARMLPAIRSAIPA